MDKRIYLRSLAGAIGAIALAGGLSVSGAQPAAAYCVDSIVIPSISSGGTNCTANGPGGPSFDGFGDIYIGAYNGSANGNNLGNNVPGFANTIQIGNTGLGLANGSGNANIVFSDPARRLGPCF